MLDLIVVKFLARYLVKPIYVFGGFGHLRLSSLALPASPVCLYLKFFARHRRSSQTPLPSGRVMLLLIGVMSILMGLLAEIMVRTYFESQGTRLTTSFASYQLRRGRLTPMCGIAGFVGSWHRDAASGR